MKNGAFNTENRLDTYQQREANLNAGVSPFGANRAADIAYRKAERLAIAAHLVTNNAPENEPARNALRRVAQEVLVETMHLRDGVRASGGVRVHAVLAKVRTAMSLLDILHAAGWVSDMNTDVVKFAYADLARFVGTAKSGEHSESFELPEDYFSMSLREPNGQESKGQKTASKGDSVKDTVTDTKIVTDTKTKKAAQNEDRNTSVRVKRRMDSRRMQILDVISKKKKVHIKDITKEVSGVGEKTIQRELASLVADGVVVKEGTKRWTVYTLAL